jgi:tetratricopeptide (TPR) repeat protein
LISQKSSCFQNHIPKTITNPTQSKLILKPSTVLKSNTSTIPQLPPLSSTGEADQCLRNAIFLEQKGLSRTAHAAYHQAATLYQCFLDGEEIADRLYDTNNYRGITATIATTISANEFAHVTSLQSNTPSGPNACSTYLAYACTRLAHLSHDALGDPRAAVRLYKDAIHIRRKDPSAFAYDGLGTSLEASKPTDLPKAIEAYTKGLSVEYHGNIAFHLAVALERQGLDSTIEKADELMEKLRRSEAKSACLVDSWGYIRWHTRRVPNESLNLYLGTRSMLQIGIEAAMPLLEQLNGFVCEFGVGSGRTLRMMQEILPLQTELHGFDTFTGNPLSWGDVPAGAYSTNGDPPKMEGKVFFHRGLFVDSIKEFWDNANENEFRPLAFANVDCDLYSSTLEVLEGMHGRVVPGTVFVFGQYSCHPNWRHDQFRAWRESCKRFGWQYEYLAFSLGTRQAAVRVTSA